MQVNHRAVIVGTGSYVPERILSNADLEKMVDTSEQWIIERTGIRERRIAAEDEATSDMAAIAAQRACADGNIDPTEIDLIIVCTVTPDQPFPSTASMIQGRIGAVNAGAFDLQAACAGFIYGLSVAASMISTGMHRRVLLIGADTLTRYVDYTDRKTCILFGDGAGAVVLAASDEDRGIMHYRLHADGEHSQVICLPAGGSRLPASVETLAARQHYIQVEGRRVFKFATNAFVNLTRDAMKACGLSVDDVALLVPHQVNARIIEAAIRRLDFPREKCFVNIDRYGNTSAASIPIALDEACREKRIVRDDTIITMGFGAGLTWGATVLKM